MGESEFGPNGVQLTALNDYQLKREMTGQAVRACLSTVLGVAAGFAVLALISNTLPSEPGRAAFQAAGLSTVLFSIIGGCIACRQISYENPRTPTINLSPDPPHITGLGAAFVVGLSVFIAFAVWVGQINYEDFRIPEQFGLLTIVALGGGFLLLSIAPQIGSISGLSSGISLLRLCTAWLDPAGRFLSLLDRLLVHSVAPVVGMTLVTAPLRYGILLTNLTAGTLFAWFCPAPVGILGTAWSVLAVFAVARRWSWTETERERLLKTPGVERHHLRLKIDEDLRDEAIWSLILLMVILPVGMRQFYLAAMEPDDFLFVGPVQDDPVAWMGFFGVELIKALPFVDWADIYGAHGATRISPNSPIAMHAVFAARVVIDVFFLSALIQAVSISVVLSQHKRQFFARVVNTLDERIERYEIERPARYKKGEWVISADIEKFQHYDDKRLSWLRTHARKGSRLEAALNRLFELKHLEFSPPAQQLAELASDRRPDKAAITAAIELVERERDYDLDYLDAARQALNWKRGLEPQRLRVAQLLIKCDPSPDRDQIMLDMLHGQNSDSLANIRLLMIAPLLSVAHRNPGIRETLSIVASSDRASAVRKRALAALGGRLSPNSSAQGRGRAA